MSTTEPSWRLDPTIAAAVAAGRHGDPFGALGPHPRPGGVVVRAFLPEARRVAVIELGGPGAEAAELGVLEARAEKGLFEGWLRGAPYPLDYRLRVEYPLAREVLDDPYRFAPVLGEQDVYLLAEGTHRRAYERLGAHPCEIDGRHGVAFAVWAPNARRVSVVGAFNHWDGRRHGMRLRHGSGIWEIFLPGLAAGELYKYEIVGRDGRFLPLKSDPFGVHYEPPPGNASIVAPLPPPAVADPQARRGSLDRRAPIAIYEVHLGSWRRPAGEGRRYLSYRELADRLIPYAVDLGFTHLELLPVSEHPFDGSWGYQPLGLFAPTSRFGSPADFRFFVERCHEAGLGVILDWVPGHFPSDPHGIGFFDGTHLYEHEDPRLGRHMDWDTLIYNFGRNEVANFLLANALYWIRHHGIDALRVDAVASMLYLDYSRESDQWVPNVHGGRENLEAVDFLRRLNQFLEEEGEGAVAIAEESTAWPKVSRPVAEGGLGFCYKWNMGWMNDTLEYMKREPVHRRWHHGQLTFGLVYAWSEDFVLPLSHDEVVHGKGSLLGRMPGDRWQRFGNLRAYLAFMWAHPGKKLLFMGGELAQEREWSHDRELDWGLLEDPMHRGVHDLVRDLNRLYRARGALHQLDAQPRGFEWVDADDADRSLLAFLRHGEGGPSLIAVCNFTPVVHETYRIGVPEGGEWLELLNTDAREYGGSGVGNAGRVRAEAVPSHGRSHSLVVRLPPLGVLWLAPARP